MENTLIAANLRWNSRITGKCLYKLHKNVSEQAEEQAERVNIKKQNEVCLQILFYRHGENI